MKRPPASTEKQKADFLKPFEQEVRKASFDNLNELLPKIARQMVAASLYRDTTALVDVVIRIRHRFRDWGWIK